MFDLILLLISNMFSLIWFTHICSLLSDIIQSYMILYNIIFLLIFDTLTPFWSDTLYSDISNPSQSNPICFLALPCSDLSAHILGTSHFSLNNFILGYISPSSTIHYKIEVINNYKIDLFHHCHALLVACCNLCLLLTASKVRKSGNPYFENLKHLQNLRLFWLLILVYFVQVTTVETL